MSTRWTRERIEAAVAAGDDITAQNHIRERIIDDLLADRDNLLAERQPDSTVDRRRWVLQEIARDAEADVQRFEGAPFTGRSVAEYMGCQAAAIKALANIVNTLLPAEPAPAETTPAGVAGYPIGTRRAGVVAVQHPGRGAS